MNPPAPHPVLRELRALAKLAVPIAAAQAGQSVMSLVDVGIVGRLGARPIGAIGLANSIFFFGGVIGLGTIMGLDPLNAQAIGAGDSQRARRLLWQGVWLALAGSLLLGGVLLASPAAMRMAHVGQATAALTASCLYIRIASMPGMLLFAVMRSYLQAHGKTRPMVISTVACNVLNLAGDLLLVFGGAALPAWAGPLRHIPALGAMGAAIATSLGTYLQLVIVAVAALGLDRTPLPAGARRPNTIDLKRAVRVGLPIGLQMGAEVGVFSLVTVLAARLGDASLAAHNMALSLASFSFSIAIGIGNAGSVRVGWAIGRRDTRAARLAGLVAFGAGATSMAGWAVVFLLGSHWLPWVYPGQHEVLAVAVPLLAVAGVFQLSDGVQGVGAGILRGTGDTIFAFIANVGGHYLIGLPIALWLGLVRHGGITGLWWGLCCGLTVVAAALFTRFWKISSKTIAPLESAPTPARDAA